MQEHIAGLVAAIGGGQVALIVGAALVVLTALVRLYVEPKLEGGAKLWISASAAWVGGIAVLLAVGQVWWHALLIGGLASATSSGLLRLLADPLARWLNRTIPNG